MRAKCSHRDSADAELPRFRGRSSAAVLSRALKSWFLRDSPRPGTHGDSRPWLCGHRSKPIGDQPTSAAGTEPIKSRDRPRLRESCPAAGPSRAPRRVLTAHRASHRGAVPPARAGWAAEQNAGGHVHPGLPSADPKASIPDCAPILPPLRGARVYARLRIPPDGPIAAVSAHRFGFQLVLATLQLGEQRIRQPILDARLATQPASARPGKAPAPSRRAIVGAASSTAIAHAS